MQLFRQALFGQRTGWRQGAGQLRQVAVALCLPVGLLSGAPSLAQQATQESTQQSTQEPAVAEDPGAADARVVAPGAAPGLQQQLIDAWQQQGPGHEARTEHFLSDGTPKYINRLILEASPYLHQHAHNPVNWYPWGDEAFAQARAEDKPVFLSIGYSTCHWCHVMERESFENEAIAAFMNEHFIAIKVDREQLPDVDAMYMSAVQILTGRGGWPMSSFLDTEARPFFGGTYFPPDTFQDLLTRVNQLWSTRREVLVNEAQKIAEALAASNSLIARSGSVGVEQLRLARNELLATYDSTRGGFGGAPRFPQESTLMFLLEQARDQHDKEALDAVDYTLTRMAAGGIHDQIGGGFHRYSVDQLWLVPHFEKMLYNQAGLARAYTLAWQLTANADHEATARDTLDYVVREMTSDEGLFYSATDADSEGREGAYFTWTPEQLVQVLGAEDARVAEEIWGIDHVGNFEGESIPHRPFEPDLLARRLKLSVDQLNTTRADLSARLLAARAGREPPLRDDKILTGWNGLMIAAFAEAGLALGDDDYTAVAKRAAQTLWDTAWSASGGLLRSRYRGKTSLEARQTDYVWLADGYVALYDATGERIWLDRAVTLMDAMSARFAAEEGGFYLGSASVAGTVLLSRPRDVHDASTPSGNGVALSVYARLFDRTGEREHEQAARKLVADFSGLLAERRGGLGALLSGLAVQVGGEHTAVQYAGRGKARAELQVDADGQVDVDIALADGWHLNAAEPLQDYLIGTNLTDATGATLDGIRYPEPHIRTLAFQSEELSLYEGEVSISGQLPAARNDIGHATVRMRLQVCSDEVCLAPETLEWSVPPPS